MDKQITKASPSLYQRICDKASKIELIEQYANLSLPKIIEDKCPSIAALEKAYGKETTVKVMAVIIADLNTSCSGELNKDDIIEVVTEIRSSITRSITLEGLYLICSKLKRTSTYKLTIPAILKAVEAHLEDQTQLVMKKNYNQHLATKHREPRELSDPLSDAKFQEIKAAYFKRTINKDGRP